MNIWLKLDPLTLSLSRRNQNQITMEWRQKDINIPNQPCLPRESLCFPILSLLFNPQSHSRFVSCLFLSWDVDDPCQALLILGLPLRIPRHVVTCMESFWVSLKFCWVWNGMRWYCHYIVHFCVLVDFGFNRFWGPLFLFSPAAQGNNKSILALEHDTVWSKAPHMQKHGRWRCRLRPVQTVVLKTVAFVNIHLPTVEVQTYCCALMIRIGISRLLKSL